MPFALVSVYDKSGLADFARRLAKMGWRFLGSGGSAALLRKEGLEVVDVADYTASPEMLGGRVKTLHPAIHGGILARDTDSDRAELASRGWHPIDLVIVNLYPFEATIARPLSTEDEAIEEIDIGGVALIRAAAKNKARVALVCDPADYGPVALEIEAGGLGEPSRRRLAKKGFALSSAYDSAIAAWLEGGPQIVLPGIHERSLRYGENPHQTGEYRSAIPGGGPLGGRVLGGKELSYNNILDLDAAWRSAGSFGECASVIVKHLSPCGIALGEDAASAFQAALDCDPVSAYGGVVAFNRVVDARTAEKLCSLFLECIIAPAFDEEARKLLSLKQNLRLVEADLALLGVKIRELRSVTGGWLVQDRDHGDPTGTEWRCVSKREPSGGEYASLRFAWICAEAVRSNAIVLARATRTVGIGGGQTNRVDAVRQAIARAGVEARGSVMASDAFFPFPDGVEEAASAGVTAVVHPGGSLRDTEVLEAADRAGMAVMITGVRHFRH